MSRRRKIHVATGADAARISEFLRNELDVQDGSEVFHLAQCLAFLILGKDATRLAEQLSVPKNRYALRKLRSTLRMLDSVFEVDPDAVAKSTDDPDPERTAPLEE